MFQSLIVVFPVRLCVTTLHLKLISVAIDFISKVFFKSEIKKP